MVSDLVSDTQDGPGPVGTAGGHRVHRGELVVRKAVMELVEHDERAGERPAPPAQRGAEGGGEGEVRVERPAAAVALAPRRLPVGTGVRGGRRHARIPAAGGVAGPRAAEV